jgi:hypothetical protein
MTKLWALGIDLTDVVAMASVNVAETIGRTSSHGRLEQGGRRTSRCCGSSSGPPRCPTATAA